MHCMPAPRRSRPTQLVIQGYPSYLPKLLKYSVSQQDVAIQRVCKLGNSGVYA